jgi:signal transduction histidine kinase/CheY-like chemotaxis protein
LIRSDIDRDTFAVVRGNDSYKVRCPELYTYRSLTAFIDRLTHMNEDEYESFHTRVNIASIKQHMMQEHVLYHNFRLMNKAGDSTTYQLKIVPFGIWPESRWILLGIYNIEETVRAEESQRQMLKEALDKAEHANRAKTSFLSNMSHEIRTPMNAIIGLNNIALKDQDLKPHTREQLEKIGASANHLLGIINDILDMSRIESGRMEIKDEEFSFHEFLEQVNVMVSGQCTDKKLHYECIIIGKTENYYIGDKMKLKQVLINILGNAVKFTSSPGSVTLTVEQKASFGKHRTLSFIISDTGIGMNKEYIPKIFDTFSQENEGTSNKYGSTGLGMAITKNIVTMMNGDINVESEKGVGSTFTVTVTLKAAEHSVNENPDETLLKGLNALVVDDEQVTCEHTQLIAETVGIRTDVAESGEKGLEMICSSRAKGKAYQLILTDCDMPVMDGISFIKELRGLNGGETMVILLTDYDWKDVREEAIRAGADAVLYKPLFTETLTQCVRDIISKRENAFDYTVNEDVLELEGLEGSMVLFAEDMDVNAEIMMALLEMREIRFERAENGKIAVELFSKHPAGYYDAILMDIRMPVMDGLEATRTIRAMERPDAKSIPIIAMTANAFDEDVQNSLQAGMNAHLSKPVEPERLYETLDRMIQIRHEKNHKDSVIS